ncbi:MAG: hypothetical protein ACI4JK_05725 [Oscillospiraceae bacterium]
MKHIKSALEFLAFLQVLFIIYGVCGAYEQDYITALQLVKYLSLFGSALAVNILSIKALTAAAKMKNREFFISDCNRLKRLVMPVRFDYLIKHTTSGAKCQCPKNEQKRPIKRFADK